MATSSEETMNKTNPERPRRRRRWLTLLLLLLIGFGGYGGYRLIRTDPAVKKVRDLRKELADANLSPDQRRDKFRQLREAMDKLPPQKREQMQREMAEEGRKRFEEQMKRYAKMSPDEKTRYLDQQIDRMEQFRQRRQQQNQNGSGPGTGAGGVFTSGPAGGGQRGPGGQAQGGAGGGQGFGNGQQSSAEDRERRRKQMLDQTTPEFRAMRDQYFKDLRQRQQQRGFTTFGR
jgi:cell division protein FtsB